MPLRMDQPTYTTKRKANTLHPTTGLCTRPLGLAPDYWALQPTTCLCTRLLGFSPQLLGFSPSYWAFTQLLCFHPDIKVLPQTQYCQHSSDQHTQIGNFPLNFQPLSITHSHMKLTSRTSADVSRHSEIYSLYPN